MFRNLFRLLFVGVPESNVETQAIEPDQVETTPIAEGFWSWWIK